MPRVLCIGEPMVELSPARGGSYRQGFAGDVLNMAWYLRRCLPQDWVVGLMSDIGRDALSDDFCGFLADTGISTDHLQRHGDATLGLYMIRLQAGERSFSYWRGQSAARRLADDTARLTRDLAMSDQIVFSGITLAILPAETRAQFLSALVQAKANGTRIAFDPNHRPRLWSDTATARAAVLAAARIADEILTGREDEAMLFETEDPGVILSRYRELGAETVLIRNGGGPVAAWDRQMGDVTMSVQPIDPVDTTAAGDSFNAAYLAARIRGMTLLESMQAAADLAGQVIRAPGALVETPIWL